METAADQDFQDMIAAIFAKVEDRWLDELAAAMARKLAASQAIDRQAARLNGEPSPGLD